MTATDILQTIGDSRKAAANAHLAGFDGVEIHAANGYLIDQFLQSKSNVRTDDDGGTTTNRVRFLREVVEAVLDVWESTRVGVRISPSGTFNDMADEDPERTFSQVVDMLNDFHLGYLHVVEAAQGETPAHEQLTRLFKYLRGAWKGIYIVNGGYDAVRGELAVSSGHADAVAYGRLFLANPDLPKRLRHRGPLNAPDPKTFYGGTAAGYIDYPDWSAHA